MVVATKRLCDRTFCRLVVVVSRLQIDWCRYSFGVDVMMWIWPRLVASNNVISKFLAARSNDTAST